MKKHKILYVFSAIAVLFGFTACSSDEEINDSVKGNPVLISASVAENSIFTRSSPTGDMNEQSVFKENDQISVNDGNKTAIYTYDGIAWTAILNDHLTWHSAPTSFKAYYPVGDGYSYEQAEMPLDQSTLEKIAKADYMKADTSVTKEPTNHTLALKFKRQTARVIVKITDYMNQFDKNTVIIESVKVRAFRHIPQNDYYGEIMTYKSNDGYIALVPPTNGGNGRIPDFLVITVKASENAGLNILLVSSASIPAMEAGKSYTYNITVGKDVAYINNVSVNEWPTDEIIPGGRAVEM